MIWTNGSILLIMHLGTNFSGTAIKIATFSFKNIQLKMSSAKWQPFCFNLNVLSLSVLNHIKSHYGILYHIRPPYIYQKQPRGKSTWEYVLSSKGEFLILCHFQKLYQFFSLKMFETIQWELSAFLGCNPVTCTNIPNLISHITCSSKKKSRTVNWVYAKERQH